ncbi:PfkB family carbohydrate kinase [Paenibacillus cymbidii]|uniref:PfkB family carbohydrate kinase n=1 Tax=Paenibacillus cymbidii TaxID=1639034 RepID=UPI00108148EF|nr:PfkB family carbohydrate kinase [Paenibacillus cymbidii]
MNASVVVIGTIFIDCKGFAGGPYHALSRNLGRIEFVHGGVARNVAENMANLDVPVTFLTTADRSGIGQEVLDRLTRNGINCDHIAKYDGEGMGMWLAILDENGNLAGSISQMPDLAHYEELIRLEGEQTISQASHVVLELDLNEQVSRRVVELAALYKKPVYGIPGNFDVISRHPELLRGMACFICNHHEAERLLNADLSAMLASMPAAEAADAIIPLLRAYLNESGVQSIVVTMGAHGSVYCDDAAGTAGYQPVFPVRLVDSTGAGDAFFSGAVTGLVRGLPLAEAVVCGTRVAAWTIESAESTCPDLRDRMRRDPLFERLYMRK